MQQSEGWKLLHKAGQLYEADLLVKYLADENIEAYVIDRKDTSLAFLGMVEVYVHEKDYDIALSHLVRFNSNI
jgi:hypothetical protein